MSPNFTLPFTPLQGVVNNFTWQADVMTVVDLVDDILLAVGFKAMSDKLNGYSTIYHIVTNKNIIIIPFYLKHGDDLLQDGVSVGNFIFKHKTKLSHNAYEGTKYLNQYIIKAVVCKRVEYLGDKIKTEINAYNARKFDFIQAMDRLERQAKNKCLADIIDNPISEATKKSNRDVHTNCLKGMQGNLH